MYAHQGEPACSVILHPLIGDESTLTLLFSLHRETLIQPPKTLCRRISAGAPAALYDSSLFEPLCVAAWTWLAG